MSYKQKFLDLNPWAIPYKPRAIPMGIGYEIHFMGVLWGSGKTVAKAWENACNRF